MLLSAKFKSIVLRITILFITPLFSGCFEVVEEVTVKENGSGSMVYTLNLSMSKTNLNTILLMDSINGHKVPSTEKIREDFALIVKKVRDTPGVSNVRSTIDLDEYIFMVSCDFTNVDVLNSVLSEFSSKKDAEQIQQSKHFTYDKSARTFARNYHYNLSKEYQTVKEKDKKIFETASYTTIYRFEKPITSAVNANAKISGSRKAVMLKANIQDIISNKTSLKNKIILSP